MGEPQKLFSITSAMTVQQKITLCMAGLVIFVFLNARAWATEIPAADYLSRIQNYIALLEQRVGKLQSEEISWFSERFPPDLVVRDVAGEGYLVDREGFLHWIKQAENKPEGRDGLIAYQKTLLNQISWEADGRFQQEGSWQESRTILDQIYKGKEFSKLVEKRTPPWREHLREFFESLGKWLEEHFKFFGGVRGKWIFFAAYLFLFVLAAVLIIWLMRLLGPVGWRWRQPRGASPVLVLSSSEKGWREWRDQADRMSKQGAFREAIRFLFISVLLEGQQKGWWLYEPEATNREHLARVENTSLRSESLQRLIETYELAWYGLRQPGRQEFQECKHLAQSMESLA